MRSADGRSLHGWLGRHSAAAVLTFVLLASCAPEPTAPTATSGAAHGWALDVVSGDKQTAVVGTQLPPLIVKVTNNGNPVVGQALNFRVVTGGGSVFGGTEVTDARGIAQELWTLGPTAGPQSVEARLVSATTGGAVVQASFTATAAAGPAAVLKISAGDQQTAVVGTAVATRPAALVADKYGNGIPNVAVTFAVTRGGGSLTGASQTTGANGVATVGGWTLGTIADTNALAATTPTAPNLAGSPLAFTAFAMRANAARLVTPTRRFAVPPGSVVTPVARVVDPDGNGVPNVAVTFTVTAGGGSLEGVSTLTTLTGPTGAAHVDWSLGSGPANTLQATTVGLTGSPQVFTASSALYVASSNTNSVVVYPIGSTGNATPSVIIAGANTGLAGPFGIARDASGALYVTNNNNSVTVYTAGASGNVAPVATIAGASTGLAGPSGAAIDASGRLYVANQGNTSITVYAAGASGNVSPVTTIAGPNTNLSRPIDLTFDASGNLYVVNLGVYGTITGNSSVTVYPPGANGNATPLATIMGGNTGMLNSLGVALDAAGNIYVSNYGNTNDNASNSQTSITVFAMGASGNIAPINTIAGLGTLSEPTGLVFDSAGNLYVTNFFGNFIAVYSPGATTPSATIGGSNTGLDGPGRLTF